VKLTTELFGSSTSRGSEGSRDLVQWPVGLQRRRRLFVLKTGRRGKTLELEQLQYFVGGRGTLRAKKGCKHFWGWGCRKWGIALFQVMFW